MFLGFWDLGLYHWLRIRRRGGRGGTPVGDGGDGIKAWGSQKVT